MKISPFSSARRALPLCLLSCSLSCGLAYGLVSLAISPLSPLNAAPKSESEAKTTLKVGAPAPDFTLTDHKGTKHHLAAYQGKTVVLEWTNPSCPFVVRHYKAKTMSTLKAAHPEVVWLTIDSSHFATHKNSAPWAKKEGVSAVLNDASGEVGRLYGARTTPHMFVINKQGLLSYQGAIDDDPYGEKKSPLNYVSEALKSLSAGKEPSKSSTRPYGCSVKYKR